MSGLGSNLRALAAGFRPAKDVRGKFIKRGWMTPDGKITPAGTAALEEREKPKD